jgi:hypothetical protein
MNAIIDLGTYREPTDHDFDNFNWSANLSLLRRSEAELLQRDAWLISMDMNVTFILFYRPKFQQINYMHHCYSFMKTNAICHRQWYAIYRCTWNLLDFVPHTPFLWTYALHHLRFYDPSQQKVASQHYEITQMSSKYTRQCTLHLCKCSTTTKCNIVWPFPIAYATDIAFNILPSQFNYNVSMMRIHLHTCLCLSTMTPFLMHLHTWLHISIHSYHI